MNKKQLIQNLQVQTPKEAIKNTRTLSHNSSSGSLKARAAGSKTKPVGKQNYSSNLLSEVQKNQNIKNVKEQQAATQLKGLKKIKNKVQNNALTEGQKKLSNDMSNKFKGIHIKQNEKNSQNHHNSGSKSLLSNKGNKNINKSDKKLNTLISEKITGPKSIPKKVLATKKTHKKSQTQVSLNTIINTENHSFQMQKQISSIQATPKLQNQSSSCKIKIIQHLVQQTQKKQENKKLMISQFNIKGKLCQGTFSTTFQVIHIETGFLYCLKVFEKLKIKQQGLQQQIISEINFRKNTNNKNLQKLFAFFDDEVYIYFVEEYLMGFKTIEKDLHTKRKFTEKQSGIIFKEVLETIRYIHSQNYIHRDIRLSNLAKCFGVVKLIDFSWVACLKYKKQRDTFCGAYKYAPPQLLEGQNYDQSIDIWSLGILLYQISTGQSPFNDGFCRRNSHSMNFPIFLSNQLVDLIGRLLSQKGARMCIQQIMIHQWTNKWDIDGFVCKQIWDFWVL